MIKFLNQMAKKQKCLLSCKKCAPWLSSLINIFLQSCRPPSSHKYEIKSINIDRQGKIKNYTVICLDKKKRGDEVER
jgi:hypothetical protein